MDGTDAEAGVLEDRDPEEYPAVLRVTSTSEEAHRQADLDRLDHWEAVRALYYSRHLL